ncbi:TonB-dependent receptor plug domain-containing protein, partial [Escherichia coli]|uniref:TonB-dependent receptor plug domain-containing protein n=1 Tax=Escherichia coli TaxID=562 RepID=UPI0020CF2C4C
MLYNIPCRIYILSTLSLCISGIVSTATATSSETKISNEEALVVTTNRSASNLWESPATIQVIDQQTLHNSTNASIADNLQDIPGVEITDNSLAGRKQIRIRGEASSRVLILIDGQVNRPGFPGECFICELRLPDHRFRWKHNKLFL